MRGNEYKRKPLSYFNRDIEVAMKLSECVKNVHPETTIMEALEIAHFIHKRIMRLKPELKRLLESMEELIEERLRSRDERFRYEELYQLSLLAKTYQDITLRRYLCAYKMLLSVAASERLFVDAILIYYSAIIEDRVKEDINPENDKAIMSDIAAGIGKIMENLNTREENYPTRGLGLAPFATSMKRERETDYIRKLSTRLESILDEKSSTLRRDIRKERSIVGERTIPEHDTPNNYGYKFRKSLYSNHSLVLKETNKIIQAHPELSQQGYALFISIRIMEAFRKYPRIYAAMHTSMETLKEHLENKATKRALIQSLVRLALIADQEKDDAVCYEVESFVNSMESIIGKQVSSRALRTDLSASLECNYHIQSPRKTSEILDYHVESIRYMDAVMQNYDGLLPLMKDLGYGSEVLSEPDAPYRPDMEETDIDYLMSGAENMGKAYQKYVKNTRSPLPLDDKLQKDAIDEQLSRTDDIRYEIFSIVPDEEDIRLFRSMNFNIRDIF